MAELSLTPVGSQDGRGDVRLTLTPLASLQVGRASKNFPNPYGIKDPRISRAHIRIFSDPSSGEPMVAATGQHPIFLSPVSASKQNIVLHRGQSSSIRTGDQIDFVAPQTLKTHSNVAVRFKDNRCAYRASITTKRKAPMTIEGGATVVPDDGSPPFKVHIGDTVKFVPF